MLSPFSAAGAVAVAMQVGRERMGDASSISSASSMSPLPSSPAQALGYRGREGLIDARYQSPLDDFRVSQETLLDHENRRYAWSKDFVYPYWICEIALVTAAYNKTVSSVINVNQTAKYRENPSLLLTK